MKEKLHIVIADDHEIVRKGIRQILVEKFPFPQITEVGDAESLLAKIGTEAFDLVILDISLPGRSGIEALKEIRRREPKLPVLILSVNPIDQYGVRTIKYGAAGYLMKDTASVELVEAINQILQGRKYLSIEIAQKLARQLSREDDKELYEYLSDRELEVFKKLAAGISLTEIAASMFLSVTTISTYRSRVLDKLNLKTNADLVQYAIEKKII